MSTIQFAQDAIYPVRTNGSAGGVYSMRNVSKTSGLAEKASVKDLVLEETDSADHGLRQEGDLKKKQIFKGRVLLWLAYQSIGVIYGDIGTSPLYVYSSTFSSEPAYDDLLGALSLIIWALILMVCAKYVFIVLNADDEGEGGTFALYSLLSRYAHIARRDPKEESMVRMERYLSSDLKRPGRAFRSSIEKSPFAKAVLKIVGVLGVSLVMSDGVLTPAQSILGAIQGLEVVKPSINTSTIVGVSIAIVVVLFLIQPLGTAKIASGFAPIVIIWLGFNAAFGIYNLIEFDHSVLKAFSPYFAGAYLVRNRTDGWRSLGGILLAFTGVEAMFADLGAFSKRAIQLSWMCFTFPCLLLAYIGQAAYISIRPAAYSNPFFNSVPPGMLYPSLVVAILAAIVASQAMITSTFQLLSQIMKLSYFPQIKLVHTSKTFFGQIYIPFANWLMMVGTIIVTGVYHNTTRLGNAYGVCVIFVTFITTSMVSIVALIIWRLNPLIVIFGFLVFGAFDCAFLSSALTKVPDGAWFTLALACVLSSVFILWRFGKEQQWHAEASDRFPPTHLVSSSEDGELQLTPAFGGSTLTNIKGKCPQSTIAISSLTLPGFAIFFDKAGDMTPTVFIQFLSKFAATPDVIVFFHLRPLPAPSVPAENRYTVTQIAIPNCYRLVVRYGYTDEVISENLAMLVHEQIRAFIVSKAATPLKPQPVLSVEEKASQSEPSPQSSSTATAEPAPSDLVGSRLVGLQRAYDKQVLYIVGKEQMRVLPETSLWRRVALNAFLWLRENTRSRIAGMKIPTAQLVEVGFVKEV